MRLEYVLPIARIGMAVTITGCCGVLASLEAQRRTYFSSNSLAVAEHSLDGWIARDEALSAIEDAYLLPVKASAGVAAGGVLAVVTSVGYAVYKIQEDRKQEK